MNTGRTALLVAAAVSAGLAGASLIGPPDSVVEEHPAVTEPVVRQSLVCPYVGGEAESESQIGVLSLPGVESPEAGEDTPPVTVRALDLPPDPTLDETPPADPAPAPEPIMSVTERGVPTISDVKTSAGTSFAVEAEGALAPGLGAEQSMLVDGENLRGLSTTSCTTPGREHWFVGASGEVGRRGRLILTNPSDVPALVDIELWDEAGPVDAAATKDIAVPARSQQIVLVDALAPDSAQVAVRVSTSQGRVSAALEQRETDKTTPQGFTFIPAAAAPATEVVVPGVPGHGQRSLRIFAPGDTDAIVSMRVLGPSGPFTPTGIDVLTVPAGTVLDVPLDSIGTDPVSIELTSDEPVTASVRVVDTPSDGGLPEVAYTSATEPLAGSAPVLLGREGGGFTTTLFVTSVTTSASRVVVRTLGADGAVVEEQSVDIPAGGTVAVPLSVPDGASYATAVVEPAQPGAVTATREISATDDAGSILDLAPLVAPIVNVEVPEVVGELPAVPEPTSE